MTRDTMIERMKALMDKLALLRDDVCMPTALALRLNAAVMVMGTGVLSARGASADLDATLNVRQSTEIASGYVKAVAYDKRAYPEHMAKKFDAVYEELELFLRRDLA